MPSTVCAQRLALRTNVLFDLLEVPNIGAEMTVGTRSTLGLDIYGANGMWGHDVLLAAVQPEWRYWFNGRPMTRSYIGIGGLFDFHDLHWKHRRYSGYAGGAGLTMGYVQNLGRRVNLEAHFGFGALVYRQREERDGTYLLTHTDYALIPTKFGVSISWIIQ